MKKEVSIIFKAVFTIIILLTYTGCKTEEASVVRNTYPSPPPEKEITVSFKVEPEEFIKDRYGYIGIEYFTNEQEKEKIKTRLDKKNAPQPDYEKAYKQVPEYGNIVLHIGRKNLMHANTQYYRYSVKKGERALLDFNGREGIPNIKGQDGNWWNIVKLPVRENIDNTLSVKINDNKTGDSYSFRILRIETVQ